MANGSNHKPLPGSKVTDRQQPRRKSQVRLLELELHQNNMVMVKSVRTYSKMVEGCNVTLIGTGVVAVAGTCPTISWPHCPRALAT